MSMDTQSVVTPYAQETNYETGRMLGQLDRTWGTYCPPRDADPAMLAGYETGWSQQNLIETESHADTDDEAQFELELDNYGQ